MNKLLIVGIFFVAILTFIFNQGWINFEKKNESENYGYYNLILPYNIKIPLGFLKFKKESTKNLLYQGPVPKNCDEYYFRLTGKTKCVGDKR